MTTSPSGPRVLACGLATLDVVQTVEHVPTADEKLVASGLLVGAGGPAANAAVTAVALGVPARLVTRIGGAALGRVVTADLVARGVEVIDRAGPDDAPAVSTVLVTRATGERAVVSVNATGGGGSRPSGPAGSSDRGGTGSVFDGVAAVLVDGHHLDLALDVARAARTRGIPVLLDAGSWKPGLEALLGLVDVALLSADFRVPADVRVPDGIRGPDGIRVPADLRDTRSDTLDHVAAWGPAVVAQSHGAGAVVVVRDGARTTVAVPSTEVVDTLGAGDVLHGALVAWLARDPAAARDPLDAVRWATVVASASVGAAGAHGWQDDAATIDRLRAGLARG